MKLLDKITIYDRYIFKQVFWATAAAVLLFTIVWIAPEKLLDTIGKILAGQYSIKRGILMILYEFPNILGKAFPVGLLLGSLFTFDKLSKDSELTIFRAVGMSFWRILAPVFVLSLLVTGLCFVTYDKLIPHAESKFYAMSGRPIRTQYIYTQKDKNNIPVQSVVISKYDNNIMNDIIVLDFRDKLYSDVHQLHNIYYAKSGKNYSDKWVLEDITKYNISTDGVFENIKQIPSMEILNGDDAKNAFKLMIYATKKEREISNSDLNGYIKLLKKEGLDEEYRYMLNKYLQRFLHPFVCVLLAIMGVLLGFSKPREQRLIGFTIAIGCIFLYYITLPFFDMLAEKGILHPFITAAFPPFAFCCAIIAFYKSKDL